MRGSRTTKRLRWLAPLVIGVVLLGAWFIATESGAVRPYLLPKPISVWHSLVRGFQSGMFFRYGWTTLQESIVGFVLGTAVAIPIGYAIARSRWISWALEPYLAASQALPAVAIAPLLVLWLGYGLKAVAALCALIVFFPMVVNTAVGIRTLDRDILDAARVDGAGFWPLLLHFELPLAMPMILAGMRTAITLSITGAVVGEFVLGDRGLGGLLTIARGNFNTPLVFATMIVLTLMASCLYTVAWVLERLAIRRL